MYKAYCRSYQFAYRTAAHFLPWREPELLTGENCVLKLPSLLQDKGRTHVLIITDSGVAGLGLMDSLLAGLDQQGIRYRLYDKTVPNPTIETIEEALQDYKSAGCDTLLAFGGGSPIDCAKGVAARLARPDKALSQMKGQLKVRKAIPMLIAIPTTAGTGSEATIATVVSNPSAHEKYAIIDPALTPHIAVLDPVLTRGLPPSITAATGMDALTHAVEAYIGKSTTKETRAWSLEAVALIFKNLPAAYADGSDMAARTNMQHAAYLAGRAFTRSYVGYVHAVAHTLGGFYNMPHGLANAVILPYVLKQYGSSIYKPLAELADAASIGRQQDSDEQRAIAFISAITDLNRTIGIPETLAGIQKSDLPKLVGRAHSEANPLYPVPQVWNRKDIRQIFDQISQ